MSNMETLEQAAAKTERALRGRGIWARAQVHDDYIQIAVPRPAHGSFKYGITVSGSQLARSADEIADMWTRDIFDAECRAALSASLE